MASLLGMTGVLETRDAVDITPDCGQMQKGRLMSGLTLKGGVGVFISKCVVP